MSDVSIVSADDGVVLGREKASRYQRKGCGTTIVIPRRQGGWDHTENVEHVELELRRGRQDVPHQGSSHGGGE